MSSAVSVIIPVFNNWELTRQCLVGLAENSPPGLEVVVVDNGSSDETAENLESFGQGLFSGHFRRIRHVMPEPDRPGRIFFFSSIKIRSFCRDGCRPCWRSFPFPPGSARLARC